MINGPAYTLDTDVSSPFVRRSVNFLMLFFPITTFLLIPAIPGTTIITVFAGLLFLMIPFLPSTQIKRSFFLEFAYFFCVILIFAFSSQLINLMISLKLTNDLLLINKNTFTKTFFRPSLITQSLSLIVGYIIYLYVKNFSNQKIINFIYYGLRLLCFYALYEFVLYAATGINGDFMVNRTFGDSGSSGSLFQTVSLGGIGLMRLKGYTGEPSMFVYTVFPFWVLAFGLKRKFDIWLLFCCLLFTFSTTAYASMLLFLGFWVLYKRNFQIFFYASIFIIIACLVLQMDRFQHLFDSIYDFTFGNKLGGQSSSSQSRGRDFTNHISFWANLNGWSQAFGIGFGYVRSGDFFSTLMLNNGIIGFIVFSWFVLRNVYLTIPVKLISICYKLGLGMVFLILMTTVPEFAYPSFWIYVALGFVLERIEVSPEALTEPVSPISSSGEELRIADSQQVLVS
jgi:hypothetical protein